MAGKSKYSVYNNANNPLDRTFDGTRTKPKYNGGSKPTPSSTDTFSVKANGKGASAKSSMKKKSTKKKGK